MARTVSHTPEWAEHYALTSGGGWNRWPEDEGLPLVISFLLFRCIHSSCYTSLQPQQWTQHVAHMLKELPSLIQVAALSVTKVKCRVCNNSHHFPQTHSGNRFPALYINICILASDFYPALSLCQFLSTLLRACLCKDCAIMIPASRPLTNEENQSRQTK